MNQENASDERQRLAALASDVGGLLERLLRDAQHEFELATAAHDEGKRSRAEAKIAAWSQAYDLFSDALAAPTIEQVDDAYGESIGAARRDAKRRLDSARAADDERAALAATIRLNILGTPVTGIFTSRFKRHAGRPATGATWEEAENDG